MYGTEAKVNYDKLRSRTEKAPYKGIKPAKEDKVES